MLPAEEEPGRDARRPAGAGDEGTAGDWLPGIRDEHEGDDAGWMARWLDRQTWDRRVTPNVIKRTGERPAAGASDNGRGAIANATAISSTLNNGFDSKWIHPTLRRRKTAADDDDVLWGVPRREGHSDTDDPLCT